MDWCCQHFKFRAELVGLRGFSIRVGDSENSNPEFFLQFRTSDAGEKFTINEKISLVIGEESKFTFCPWCGKNSLKFYKKTYKSLVRDEYIIDLLNFETR